MRRAKWGALTGVLFVVLAVAGFLIGGQPPDATDPVDEIVEHYTDDDSAIMLGASLVAMAGVALVFFGGYLRSVLRAGEGRAEWLASVALAGTAVMAVGAAIDATIAFALAEAADEIEPEGVQTLQALWDNDFLPIAAGTAMFLLASGIAIVVSRALPRWLGWVAVVLGVIGLTPAGFFAFVLSAVWIVVVSIMLATRGGATGSTSRDPGMPSAPQEVGQRS